VFFAFTVAKAQTVFPDIKLKNLEGQTISLIEMSKDKTIVVDFWATLCGLCVNELDAFAEEYEDLQDETGFELIAVSVDNSRSKSRVKAMVDGKGWDYQVLLDTNQELQRALNIAAPPYVLIVKNGKILYTHSGYTPGGETEIYEKFEAFK
jgi:peroxiredoxin